MQNGGTNPDLKSWIPAEDLKSAPSLMNDYKDLAALLPGNQFYDANARRYVASWKEYWSEYIPELIATQRVPDSAAWGSYPTLRSDVSSVASQTYNVLVHSFTPTQVKGIIFLTNPSMVEQDQGEMFAEQLSALANSWKARFGGDPHFHYTIPSKELAPKITRPTAIKGANSAIEINDWSEFSKVIESARKQ